ncbi:ribonuclease P protein component [Candidatus Pacebacteria bacterium]|nr:ribonuclease P protein component [Candidatus Paceibacterota bacterium]
MLSKRDRITTERFKDIIENGKTVRSAVLYTKLLPNKIHRFSVVVPKKVVKSAVRRNLLKRKIVASISNNWENFVPADYIIFATEQVIGSNGVVLDNIIKDLAEKVASQN